MSESGCRVRYLLPLVLLLASAAANAPLADPVSERIIATAKATTPAELSFDRTTTMVRDGGGTTTRTVLVERWDGSRWTLVRRNGKVPTADQRRSAEAEAKASPVPGYYRLAELVSAATERRTDADGRTVLVIPVLPEGSVRSDSKDISRHLSGEVTIGSANGKPFVERLRVKARENFKLNLLIRVHSFEQISEYGLDAAGRPRLRTQTADSRGSMFGFPGGMKSEITYAYR